MKKVFHKTHFSRLELLLLYFFDFFVFFFRFSGGDARRSGMDGMRIFFARRWWAALLSYSRKCFFHISRHDEVRGVRKMLHFFNFRFGVSLRGALSGMRNFRIILGFMLVSIFM